MQSTPVAGPLSVSPTSLAAAFEHVPDPRRAASVVYPLPAILALAVTAILANHLSVLAMAEWGARQDAATLGTLGFPTARTPCHSTLHRLFRQLDGHVLAARLSACFGPSAVPAASATTTQAVAVDGKAQRGRLLRAVIRCGSTSRTRTSSPPRMTTKFWLSYPISFASLTRIRRS